MSLPEILSTDQVAEYLKVPVKTLYQWRHKGTGPSAIRVGRHLRYRVTDVEAWIESLAESAARPARGDSPAPAVVADADIIANLRRALYVAACSGAPHEGLVLDHEAGMAWEEHEQAGTAGCDLFPDEVCHDYSCGTPTTRAAS